MRYWIYKDSQILGPLAKDDLGLVGGLQAETLVCLEGNSAGADSNWRCAEEIPELAGLYSRISASGEMGAFFEPGFNAPERTALDSLAFPEESGSGALLERFFEPGPRRLSEAEPSAPDAATRQELQAAQDRVKSLSEEITALTRRLSELESRRPPQQQPIPGPPIAPERPSAPAGRPEAGPPAPEPVVSKPEIAPEASGPSRAEVQADPAGVPLDLQDTASKPAAPVLEIPAPLDEPAPDLPQAPAEPGPAPSGPAAKGRPWRAVKFAAPTKSLQTVRQETPPPQPAPSEPQAAPSLSLAAPQPQAPEPPAIQRVPLPGLVPPPAATPAAQSFQLGGLSVPPATSSPALFAPSLPETTVPIPTFSSIAPTPAPMPPAAMAFPQSDSAPTPAGSLPAGAPTALEALAKLAKPQPAKTEAPKKPKSRPKTFLILIGAAAALVVVAAWFSLFRNTKDIKTAVTMDSGRPPVGGEVTADEMLAVSKSQAGSPAAQPAPTPSAAAPQPSAAAPQPSVTAPQPSAAAPPAAEAIHDDRPAAIELVKSYPLDGDRGTVGAWLQYSFAASPGASDTEKWNAGAVEESTYLVQYTVLPAMQKTREAITYIFEADLSRKTVRGNNQAARELLAGGAPPTAKPAKPKLKPKAKSKAKKRAARKPAQPAKEVPLLPLPSQADMQPPAEDDAGFHSDTVQPNL